MDERTAMTEFVGPKEWPEVSCVLKRLYSDFIVVEIPKNGKVLQPSPTDENSDDKDKDSKPDVKNETKSDKGHKRNTVDKDADEPTEKRAKGEGNGGVAGGDKNMKDEENGNQDDESDDDDIANEPIPDMLSEQDIAAIEQVHNGIRLNYTLFVRLHNKEQRRAAYSYLRRRFRNKIVINSGNGEAMVLRWDDKLHVDPREVRTRYVQNRQKQMLTDEKYFPQGHNLFFTMTKVNKDTNYVLGAIVRSAKLKAGRIFVAGLKDRRAITTQQVCVPGMQIQRIKNSTRNLQSIYLSNFHYEPSGLRLGDLWGNHFEIALREFNLAAVGGESALAERIDYWTQHGFLNYFGWQRFGACGVNTADVGRHMLAGRWKEAVDTIMSPHVGEYGNVAPFINAYKSADRKAAIQKLSVLQFGRLSTTIEETIVRALADNPDDYKMAISRIKREMRSLYVHAYQSYVFNTIISRRSQKYGTAPIAGDLNKEGEPLGKNAKSTDIHYSLPSMVQSKETTKAVPDNEIADWYKEIAAADGITNESFKALEHYCIIGEVLRPMLVKPRNVSWELVDYTDPRAILQTSSFVPEQPKKAAVDEKGDVATTDKIVYSAEKPSPKKALLIRFDLPSSCYATVALRELLHADFSKDAQKRMEGVGKKLDNGQAAADTSGTSGEATDEFASIDDEEEVGEADDYEDEGTPI